jgi:ABC-2 type transport system permease protein
LKTWVLLVVLVALGALRVWRRAKRRSGAPRRSRFGFAPLTSDVGLVAAREMRERFRGRMFRVGTVLILLVVAGAIVIPTLNKGKSESQRIGVVGPLAAPLRAVVANYAQGAGLTVYFVPESGVGAAKDDLRSGRIDLAIINAGQLLVDKSTGANASSTTPQLASDLGDAEAIAAAHLSAAQASQLAGAKALPIMSLQPGPANKTIGTSVIGLILIFVMLSQYNTWILIGVMEEKSSRVIEVLLAAVRPIQLLAGKVLGIGLVALAQATAIVAFALLLAKGVGSNLLHGTGPTVVLSTLVWLFLGYAFYCWVYAAAGSMAERQDQVQSLAFPLSIPIIFGYIMALTAVSSGSVSSFFRVLAYLPPTAPFAMPVLVGLGAVTWWQFLASAAISVVCTIAMARLAAGVYRRAILRTGGRVKIREILGRANAS